MSSLQQTDRPLPTEEASVTYETEDVSTNPGNDEQEALILQNDVLHSSAGASAPPKLLVLIAPALLAGIIGKAFDIAFLSTSYARIASELQHYKDATWIHLTASICSAMFVPLHTHLLKSLGIRRAMLIAYGAFAVGTGLSGLSTSYWELLGSRFIIGLGNSGIALFCMIVINDIVGVKQLAIWESFVTCVEMGTSMVAGPLGARMYREYSWHSVFYLEFTLATAGFGILYFTFAKISSYPQYSQSMLLKRGDSHVPRIDVVGWALLVLAVAIPLVSLTLGDNFLQWTHPIEVVLLISGPIFIWLFVDYEARLATGPIMDMTPVLRPGFLRVLFQVFGVMSILNSIIFILPPYIQVRAFDGSSFEDWALTCLFLGFPLGAIFGGYLVKRGSFPVQRIMLANSAVLQCICVLFVTGVIKPESAVYSPFLVGFGLSTGIWQSCLLYATLSSTEKQWWPQTLATYYLIETFGGDLGMALVSMITRVVAKSDIRSSFGDSEATETIITDAMRDLQTIRELDARSRHLILSAFKHAMHSSLILPCAMAAGVIILAVGMNIWPPKPKHEELPYCDHEDRQA